MGIAGNELADAQAKLGSQLPVLATASQQPTIAYNRRSLKERVRANFSQWWKSSAPEQYRDLGLDISRKKEELSLPRPILHHLLAARTKHGDFADYHTRFHPDSLTAQLLCSCNREKLPTHIFYCRKVPTNKRIRLGAYPQRAINKLLGKDYAKLVKLAESSRFFSQICPRH